MDESTGPQSVKGDEPADRFGERAGDGVLRFERFYAVPIERVWRAITTPDAIAQWLGEPVAIESRAGGRFEIRFNDEDRMAGRLLAFEPPHRLEIAWREESEGGRSDHATRESDESRVTLELSSRAGGTRLVLTHASIRPDDDFIGFGGGWHAHLNALEAHVSGGSMPDRALLYERLRPAYEARFGRPVES